ncbi:hypothetical protein O6H91_10G047800 [Diphasiastrum complanatum]|uniref:Uncharacterized protein n=1 Tax=Diphasiastrum complanatum TaxID=34168 RepID=A0ACC2CH13_DIPCM|nr:hypothetical protein O6H91_10G047800 [Diphasiastrum complanatum]
MWCVLIAAWTWHLAMCWKNFGLKLTSLAPAQEFVGPGQDSCVHDLSKMLISVSNEDPLPSTGDSTYIAKNNVSEVCKQIYSEHDTNAMNNRSSVFTFSSKEDISMEEKISRFSLQKKGTIRSKFAQKGWENHESRFKGWPKISRKIRNKASVSQDKTTSLSSLSHDEARNAGSQTSLIWEADILSPIPEHSAALCPPYIEQGWSISLQEITDPQKQRLDEETSRPEEQSGDPTMLNISIYHVLDSERKGSPIAVPKETVDLSNMWTIDHELELVQKQKESEHEIENFRDSPKEPIQTFPLRISMMEDQSLNSFRNELSNTLQDAEELKFVGLLQPHDVTQTYPKTRGRTSERVSERGRENACHFRVQSSRTMCKVSTSYPLTGLANINNDFDVGVAEAFSIADLLQAEATAEGKELAYGCSTKRYDSEDMDNLRPLFLDKHLVTNPKRNQDRKPYEQDGTMTNIETPLVGKFSLSSQKRQLLNTQDPFSERASLPLFLKKRKIADCLQSISSLGTLPRLNPSVMTMSSVDAFSFSFGLGVGLMFTWSSFEDEIKTLKSLLSQAEYDQEQICVQIEDLPGEMFYDKSGMEQDDFNFDKIKVSPFKVKQAATHFFNSLVDALDGAQGEFNTDDESVKSVLTEEHMQKDNTMAELEAELEAELKLMEINFIEADCITDESMQSAIGDLDQDSFANLLSEDFPDRSLPRMPSLEQNKSFSARAKLDSNSCPVSPRELEHRLRLLVEERQKEQISQLQIQLQIAKQKLQSKEAELREWKDQVRRLVDLAFIATGNDVIEATLSPTTTRNLCQRDTLDICSETEHDRNLRSPKQQQENLIIPTKESTNANGSFGSPFGWTEERTFSMDDCYDMASSHTVSDKELEPMEERNRNYFLEHMGKSCDDRSTAKNYVRQLRFLWKRH